MDSLNKVTSLQVFRLWQNLAISLIVTAVVVILCKFMPVYLAPIISLICATALHIMISINRKSNYDSCMIVPYATFVSLITFTITLVIVNLLYSFDIIHLEDEFLFINRPFVPILILAPVAFSISLIIYLRKTKIYICVDCKLKRGDSYERGKWGITLMNESYLQLNNLIWIYGILMLLTWIYYLTDYIDINISERGSYVFVWSAALIIIVDLAYFAIRYYTLYVVLKESNNIITPDDIGTQEEQLYLRYYLICGNEIYINRHSDSSSHRENIDTPFYIKADSNSVSIQDANEIIKRLSGVEDGEIRFFYGRRAPKPLRNKILRYFYFLKGNSDNFNIETEGEWMDYEEIKRIYSTAPQRLSSIFVADTTRVATILITEKVYDSNGMRKTLLSNYKPTYSLSDIYNSSLDFQDDKWIRISMFNSDTKFYRIRRIIRKIMRFKTDHNTISQS